MTDQEEVKPDDKTVENTDELTAPIEDLEDIAPLLEPDGVPDPKPQDKVNPLSPGGKRFEQVYAQGKQAQRDLAKERELRIAAEAKLEVLNGKTEQPVVNEEYSWTQLEEFITQGRITRADAEAHREQILERKLSTRIKGDFTKENTTLTRTNALNNSIDAYCAAMPKILVEGSDERVRLDEEFNFLASVQGVDPNKMDEPTRKALQLTALRAVYGSVDALTKRGDTKQPDTHQGLPGGVRPAGTKNPDQLILDNLTKREVAHYSKMMSAGRYPGGWKDVVAEVKFQAPRVRR